MRWLALPVLLAVLAAPCANSLCAADGPSPALAKAQAAMSDDNAQAKRTAIRALGSASAGKDDEVYPFLIGAISDRQGGESAVAALISRAGKTASGGSWAAGKDPAAIQAAWNAWYEDFKTKNRVKKLDEKTEKKPVAAPVAEEAKPVATETVATKPAEDLGKIDRVSFAAGGSLLCYIMAKRTDADGNLVSVRVVHPDGAGEETIAAALISRIEEDIR